MEIIPKKHALKKSHLLGSVKSQLVNEVVNIGNYQDLKNNQELTLHCCKVVESLIEKHSKIDKKSLVIDTLHQIFSFDDNERQSIGNQIDFFFDRKMVKSPKVSKKLLCYAFDWFSKKFL